MPKTAPIDVIVVADFLGPQAMMFEARAHFFLTMWMQNAGKSKQFPLHFVCIGDPPLPIIWLAKRAGVSLTIHAPHPLGGSLNKQRGFEITPQAANFLLLDLDILVVNDFSSFATLGNTIAAAPDGHIRVPNAYWHRIYQALALPLPNTPFLTISQEYGYEIQLPHPKDTALDLPQLKVPYYNGGIVYAPWSSNLPARWLENVQRINALFPTGNKYDPCYQAVTKSDQAGLAITIQQLQQEGYSFTRLTPIQHASHVHLAANQLSLKHIELYHATNLGRNPLFPVLHYSQYLMAVMHREWQLRYPKATKWNYFFRTFPWHLRTAIGIERRLRKAYQQQFAQPFKVTGGIHYQDLNKL